MTITKIWFDREFLYVAVDSGHVIGNPIAWFPRLAKASLEQRQQYELGPFKDSIHWEAIDEDLSLESLFDFRRELDYAKI